MDTAKPTKKSIQLNQIEAAALLMTSPSAGYFSWLINHENYIHDKGTELWPDGEIEIKTHTEFFLYHSARNSMKKSYGCC
jgi:hypothetical protein